MELRVERTKPNTLYSVVMGLCRPDCRGLCAQCGADLNEGSCGCEAEATDPRLSALRAFLREP